MIEYMDKVQEILPHSWQTSTRNEQISTRSTRIQIDDQMKYHFDPEGTTQRNRPKKLDPYPANRLYGKY